ncbi:MAG TPA: pentapeptide repeat-containing protein [Thermoanaerobaculia bacterium]|nr:pentapeptide repeat-containing protein [Thermoanaerobaculia bacterium]
MRQQDFSRVFSKDQSGQLASDELVEALRATEGAVEVAFATVTGEMTLSSTEVASRVILRDCTFIGPVHFESTVFHKSVDLSGSTFHQGLTLGGARIESNLRLDSAVLHAAPEAPASVAFDLLQVTGNFLGQGLWVGARLELGQTRIGGRLDLSSTRERCTVCKGDLGLGGARVQGDLWCRGTRVEGDVILEGAIVEGAVSFGPLRESSQAPDGLVLGTTWIGGSALLAGCQASIEVDFCCAHIGRDLILQSTQIKGGLFCRSIQGHPTVVLGNLLAPVSQVTGAADFSGIDIRGNLSLEGFNVQGALLLMNGRYSHDGGPRAVDPLGDAGTAPSDPRAIGSRPTLSPVRDDLRSRIGQTLALSHAKIVGPINAVELRAGLIDMDEVEVAGYFELTRARIGADSGEPGEGPPPLYTYDEYSLSGRGAHVEGYLRLDGAKLKQGIFLQSARVEGGLFCMLWTQPEEEPQRTEIGGEVFLAGATILGELSLRDAAIDGGLSLDRATLDGTLRCRILNPPPASTASEARHAGIAGEIDLSNSTVRHLELFGADRPPGGADAGEAVPVPVRLDNCEFREITVPDDNYLALFRSPRVVFRRSNYVMVEKWLRNRGEDEWAQEVFRTMRRHRRERTKMRRWERASDRLLGSLIYLAMHFKWLLLASFLAMILTVTIFAPPRAALPSEPASGGRQASAWSPGEAAWLALRVHLPMIDLPFNDHWRPSDQPIVVYGWRLALSYRQYAMLGSMLSYIVIPLIIGGIANQWLRQKGTSD